MKRWVKLTLLAVLGLSALAVWRYRVVQQDHELDELFQKSA